MSSTLRLIQEQLTRSLYVILLILGEIGCCLNVILFSGRKFRFASCCIYFNVASKMMLIFLPLALIPPLYSSYHTQTIETNILLCKIRGYFIRVSIMTYRWLLVAACFDRYILSSTKIYLRNLATPRISNLISIIIILIWLIFSIPSPIFSSINNGKCGFFSDPIAAFYHSIYTIILGGILPICLMSIFAILIRRNLNNQVQNRRYHIRDQQIFVMLLFQIFLYIITQFPWMLLSIYSAVTSSQSNKSLNRIEIERFLSFIIDFILYLHPVFSFSIYTLTSRTYRNDLIKLCHRLLKFK